MQWHQCWEVLYNYNVTRLTRWVSLAEQELLTLPEYLSSSPVFSGVRVTRSLVLYVFFVDRCLSFVIFLLAIVLSILLRYTDCDYPFGIFKLLLYLKRQSALLWVPTVLFYSPTYSFMRRQKRWFQTFDCELSIFM